MEEIFNVITSNLIFRIIAFIATISFAIKIIFSFNKLPYRHIIIVTLLILGYWVYTFYRLFYTNFVFSSKPDFWDVLYLAALAPIFPYFLKILNSLYKSILSLIVITFSFYYSIECLNQNLVYVINKWSTLLIPIVIYLTHKKRQK